MLLVFEHAVRVESADTLWPAMAYEHNAAKAPFAVAAVCRRWRELALSTSALWTYFGFPPADEIDWRHHQRAELLRLRAGNAPIDVVFGWQSERYAAALNNNAARSIFDEILSMGSRWKNVVLHVSRGWKIDRLLLSCQWTFLEQLSLAAQEILSIIPIAPRLRRLWLDCDICLVSDPFVVAGYPSLRVFSLFCDSIALINGFCPAFGQQLTELVLIDDVGSLVEQGTIPMFTFPVLRQLTIDDGRWLHHVDAPTLINLTVTHLYIERATAEILRRFDHVKTLGICGDFNQERLEPLKELSNITTLSFHCPLALATGLQGARDYYNIVLGTLRSLAQLEPPIWPQLQCLYCEPFAPGVRTSFEAICAGELLEFVAARNTRLLDMTSTARIVEVIADYPDAPGWLKEQLRELVAIND